MFDIRDNINSIKPYMIDDESWAIKLDANERAFNLPDKVAARLAERLTGVAFNRYPEVSQRKLREFLAADLGLTVERIAVGNGSSELLAALCQVFGGPESRIVVPWPSFSMYPTYCRLADSQPVTVPLEPDFSLDPDKVAEAAGGADIRLILLSNPNNPTGALMAPADVEAIVRKAKCPVVLDEAYAEFAGQSALPLLARYENLVVVRTLSKAYGLAAARVGYAAGSAEIIAALHKVLLPYHMSALSLLAAVTVLEMREEFTDSIAETVAARDEMEAALRQINGLEVFPSAANFLFFRTAKAKELTRFAAERGIGIRDFSAYPGLAGCMRVTVGASGENKAFLDAATDFFAKEEGR